MQQSGAGLDAGAGFASGARFARQWLAMGRLAQVRIHLEERALDRLQRFARRHGAQQPEHLITGIDGELAAYFYLRRKGYVVAARRWSAGNLPGDLDLIVWQGSVLCFVEVKTRTARDITPAEAAVDAHKRGVLRRLARRYIGQLPAGTASAARFDVISVYLIAEKSPEIVHFENMFGWSEGRRDWE
jgi:putative endonuclease